MSQKGVSSFLNFCFRVLWSFFVFCLCLVCFLFFLCVVFLCCFPITYSSPFHHRSASTFRSYILSCGLCLVLMSVFFVCLYICVCFFMLPCLVHVLVVVPGPLLYISPCPVPSATEVNAEPMTLYEAAVKFRIPSAVWSRPASANG